MSILPGNTCHGHSIQFSTVSLVSLTDTFSQETVNGAPGGRERTEGAVRSDDLRAVTRTPHWLAALTLILSPQHVTADPHPSVYLCFGNATVVVLDSDTVLDSESAALGCHETVDPIPLTDVALWPHVGMCVTLRVAAARRLLSFTPCLE